jgi:hypothetical protein
MMSILFARAFAPFTALFMLPISIIIPCYNAAATLARTHAR